MVKHCFVKPFVVQLATLESYSGEGLAKAKRDQRYCRPNGHEDNLNAHKVMNVLPILLLETSPKISVLYPWQCTLAMMV